MAITDYSIEGRYSIGNVSYPPLGYTPLSYTPVGYYNGNAIMMKGVNMANGTPGLYGDILFNREFSYQPYTARSVKTGKVLGEVYEVNPNMINGLGSGSSMYGILDASGKVTYPLYSWNALLEKLVS